MACVDPCAQLVPARHPVGVVVPAAPQKYPEGHTEHDEEPGAANFPATQVVELEDPSGHFVPPGHTTGLEVPLGSLHTEPAGHVLQEVDPTISWYVPARHGVITLAPAPHQLPARHLTGF